MKVSLTQVAAWLSENWTVIALVISELAALLPTKVNGIIQFLVKIATGIFRPKHINEKKFKS